MAALRESGDAGLSGEVLAERLGVSRVAVAKHVRTLRDLGYAIDAVPGSGYRFRSAPNAPLPDEIARLLDSPMWTRLEGGATTGSTNDDARALAARGSPEGTVVLASRQTAGRGRLGRSWDSPDGGLYFSAILRPQVSPAVVSSLALALALGVARGLEALGFEPRLKWPNDVLLADGKVAGILLEMTAEADRVDRVIAGVGLNVQRPRTGAFEGATYLADHVAGVRLAPTAAAVLDGIAEAYGVWRERGFTGLHDEYSLRSALEGSQVSVRDLRGTVRTRGTVVGVDSEGRLLVQTGDEVTAVSSGEVTLS